MSTHTLEDVRQAMFLRKKSYFGAMKAYVTGFEADNDFPRKFLYRGCKEDLGHGFQCCKSLERGPCIHHPSGEQWGYMYRFDLYLVDGSISPTSPPLRVTIFDAAAVLLKLSPLELSACSEISQYEVVHAATHNLAMLDVYLTTNPGKDTHPIVEGLSIDKDGPIVSSARKRIQHARPVLTPGRSLKDESQESPSTSQIDAGKEATIRKLLFNVIDQLGAASLGDK